MNSDTQTISAQPGILQPIRAGFNVAANHTILLLFPILIDLWIWLGVHLGMPATTGKFLADFERLMDGSVEEIQQALAFARQVFVERFNLMGALRTFPVGIPSLMSSRLPVETPFGAPQFVEVGSLWNGLFWFLVISLIGLALGTWYYLMVSQAALEGNLRWRAAIRDLPWAYIQVLMLSVVWAALAFTISLPFSCLLSVAGMGGISSVLGFFYLAVMIWLFFPLLLSAHGIFVYKAKMSASLMKSIHLTRLTLPATSIFLLFGFLMMLGLNTVWGWTDEKSWLTLIGLAGHAFVANGVMAASFIYYREADLWVQRLLRQIMLQRV